MIKILFVCHGNICRSPMAEFIFGKIIAEKGVSDRFTVASCATSTDEIWNGIGSPVYPPAKRELAKHNINCDGKHAVLIRKSDYTDYDLIIGMDSENISDMRRFFGGDPENKIRRLLDFTSEKRDVADPWYTGKFGIAYDDIYKGCTELLHKLI